MKVDAAHALLAIAALDIYLQLDRRQYQVGACEFIAATDSYLLPCTEIADAVCGQHLHPARESLTIRGYRGLGERPRRSAPFHLSDCDRVAILVFEPGEVAA